MLNYKYFDHQSWDPFECSVPWEYVDLPKGEVFERYGRGCSKGVGVGRQVRISGRVKSLFSYNGRWYGGRQTVEFEFSPRKCHVDRPKKCPIRVLGLVLSKIPSSSYKFPLSKGVSRAEKLRKLLDHLNKLNYRTYRVGREEYQPMREFIAQNYVLPQKVRKSRITDSLELLLEQHLEVYFSPYMSNLQQMNHAVGRLKKELESLRLRKPELAEPLVEIGEYIDYTVQSVPRGQQLLDSVFDFCWDEHGLDLSPMIYNYRQVLDICENAGSGIYICRTMGIVPVVVHSVVYDEVRFMGTSYGSREWLPIDSQWSFKNLYLVEPEGMVHHRVPKNSTYVNVRTGQKTDSMGFAGQAMVPLEVVGSGSYECWYLVKQKYFAKDRVEVNLKSKLSTVGSVRLKALCLFKLYVN